MNRLSAELHRLYGPPTEAGTPDAPAVRALCLALTRPADWRTLSRVWVGVQTDLDWPAPGIAVSGQDGLQLWFSLAEPVSATQAQALLEALRQRYLSDVAPERLQRWPDPHQPATHEPSWPPRQVAADRWAAFIAPDLASVFADEPWLDLPPGDDAQADLLARLASIPAVDVALALVASPPPSTDPSTHSAGPANHGETDPRRFLLGVMNNPAVDLHLRIEAAKVLLAVSDHAR